MIKNNKGFTIVELLVVIVVIGILASITIVSYTGVTGRANATAAKTNANALVDKANVYQSEGSTSTWPLTLALAKTQTTSSAAYNTPVWHGDALAAGDITTGNTSTIVNYQLCGATNSTSSTAAPGSYATLAGATGIPTGVIVGYWDSGLSSPAQATLSAGAVSGTYPYVSGGTTYNNTIGCYYATS